MSRLSDAWYQKRAWLYLLWPLSIIYRLINFLHCLLYNLGIKKATRFSIPIVVVGNITVGGTGKTPLVIALANYLRAQGYKPGIISRGYKAKIKSFPQWVKADSDAILFGDEPVLIAQRTQCPLVIDPNRVNAVRELLTKTDCNIILSDDGLQHYALVPTIKILVIDGDRRFGNNLCLPAGPLRESIQRLKTVDFVVSQEKALANEYNMQLAIDGIYSIKDTDKQLDLKTIHQPVHAVAAIGNPQRFFNALQAMGLTVIPHGFPDHYLFKKTDIDFGPEAIVIMTEKDAVKCITFADNRHWFLRVTAKVDDNFYQALMQKLSIK